MIVVEHGADVLNITALENLGIINWKHTTVGVESRISKLPYVKNFYYSILLKPGSIPVCQKERIVPFALRDKFVKEINKLVEEGILRKTTPCDWASPIVIAQKKSGEIRLCSDFRKLNTAIMNDKFPIPNIEDLLAKFGNNCQLFLKLDLKEAYHQIRLAPESRPLTTIITHMGTCMYIRLSFGIKTAPSAFQRLIERILSGIKGVLVYLDDILVAAKNKRDLFHRLNLV